MYAFLLWIGVIATAIGMFTIGFGIPINEFSFGNTMILAGTVAVTGGLVLIGIAAAVRELRRIADALPTRASTRGNARTDSGDAHAATQRPPAGSARGATPSKPRGENPTREPRPEPRFAQAVGNGASVEDSFAERAGPNIFPMVRAVGEHAALELETVPLSPNVAARSNAATREPRLEMKSASQAAPRPSATVVVPPPRNVIEAPRLDIDRGLEKQPRSNLFDAVWPMETKTLAAAVNDQVVRAPRAEPAGAGRRDRPEPTLSGEKREPIEAGEPRPVSILKSGVIDGMAYTLFTDGSIEAQLAQGTMKFGSIDDLRSHLEATA
jgi:hypothetical protein